MRGVLTEAGPTRREQALFVAAAIAWIGAMYLVANPLWRGDTLGYTIPGCAIWGPNGIREWDGGRAPLYPMLLTVIQHAATGTCSPEPAFWVLGVITAVQLVLYLASIVWMYRALAGMGWPVRVGATALAAISPLGAMFTRAVLSESLALSLLNVLLAHLVRFALAGRSRRDATVVFASFTLVTLTRPNMMYPLLPIVAYVVMLGPGRLQRAARAAVCVGLPLLALMSFNQWNHLHFRITTLEGIGKAQIVFNLFDRVHPKDAVLGAVVDAQYRQDLALGIDDGLTVCRAVPAMREHLDEMPFRKRRGPGSSDLNSYLDRVATYLVRENPRAVAANTARTLARFWELGVEPLPFGRPEGGPPVPKGVGDVASPALYAIFVGVQPAYTAFVRVCILLVPVLLVVLARRRGLGAAALPTLAWVVYAGNFLMISVFNIVQVRYRAVMDPVLFVALGTAVQALIGGRAADRAGERGERPAPPRAAGAAAQ